MNIYQNMLYQEARSYSIKKLKKRLAKALDLNDVAVKSTVTRGVLERQSKLFGKFDARFVKTEIDGSCLTGSAEQGILQLLEEPSFSFYDHLGLMAHNQCFRNEEVFDEDHHYEFDKLEGVYVWVDEDTEAVKPEDVILILAEQCNRIYTELIEKGLDQLEGYKFVVQPKRELSNSILSWTEQDINLVGPDINLETHSLVDYGSGMYPTFPIKNVYSDPANMFCFTIAAFPRFLKPLTLSFKV